MINRSIRVAANALLAALPGSTLNLLEPHLKPIALVAGDVVHNVGDEIERVYFPSSGIASLQVFMSDGRAVDTAIVGRDGALASSITCRSGARCIARTNIDALTISATEYRRFAAEDMAVQMMIIRDQELLLSKTQISAARLACLSVEVRMAACFIEVANLVGSNNLPLTQEALAEMLSVRRTSVTAAACKLRAEGTIGYARGKIQIHNRDQLLKLAHPALG